MHPAIIFVPVAALAMGPRLWAGHIMKQHNRKDEDLDGTASELARCAASASQMLCPRDQRWGLARF